MGNTMTINEEVRKAIQSIRHLGSQMNMSLPVARQKSEAVKIRDKCNELITMLGGEGE